MKRAYVESDLWLHCVECDRFLAHVQRGNGGRELYDYPDQQHAEHLRDLIDGGDTGPYDRLDKGLFGWGNQRRQRLDLGTGPYGFACPRHGERTFTRDELLAHLEDGIPHIRR